MRARLGDREMLIRGFFFEDGPKTPRFFQKGGMWFVRLGGMTWSAQSADLAETAAYWAKFEVYCR